jgi:hypothetical protein
VVSHSLQRTKATEDQWIEGISPRQNRISQGEGRAFLSLGLHLNRDSSSDEDVQHGDPAASVTRQRIDINPTEIFDKSMAAFRDSLPPESQSHLVQCTNTESLILNIETIAYNFKNRSKVPRLIACCNTIKRFAQTWEPFFEVTTILVSSHPEYAACAWSAVRLVFLVCWSFRSSSFFDAETSSSAATSLYSWRSSAICSKGLDTHCLCTIDIFRISSARHMLSMERN